ncbi:Post-transcriptional regulator [Marinilactibacillus piezotolerans]|uniref:Post-transcriptional regulator n=1 Tax=Marinilactibacillus piezotolerans TaxID=258723 RepID=A0A1I4ABD2_9LACT|nr:MULTISPECIES: post-transcriptional regulator [Marinilactibacillus]SFK53644.1 Post-transcriptional regulator [Marinilactibacillus piezotolerans]
MGYQTQAFFNYETWLRMKQEEFLKNGYDQVTVEDLWKYCNTFLWKHARPERYHEEVKAIMEIKVNDYFNFASLEAQIYNVSSLDEMELNDILGK